MNESTTLQQEELLQAVLKWFAGLWFLSGIGLLLGPLVPPPFILPLVIVELLLIVSMIFMRIARKLSPVITRVFAFISGITLYSSLHHYVGELGGNLVLLIFLSTAILFVAYGMFGYQLMKNLQGFGKYLFIALIALILVSVLSIFISIGSVGMLLLSIGGVVLFSVYTIYDFNQLRHQSYVEEDVPLLALNLYLDFLNLFLHLLRLASLLKD